VTLPDSLAAACLLAPELIESSGRYYVDVDEREGLTRGYSLVDRNGVLDDPPNATVVESVDAERFTDVVLATLAGDPPERAL
jgi:purine nucleosidase